MKKGKLIDKLTFYEGFLDSFLERGETVLRENDVQHLKMLREYVIESKNLLQTIEALEE